jgi:hypothetical protein
MTAVTLVILSEFPCVNKKNHERDMPNLTESYEILLVCPAVSVIPNHLPPPNIWLKYELVKFSNPASVNQKAYYEGFFISACFWGFKGLVKQLLVKGVGK